MNQRQFLFLKQLIAQAGLPYLWDGKGRARDAYNGRDCSGFITWALYTAGGPDLRETVNSQHIWDEWMPLGNGFSMPDVGAVALYGTDGRSVHHVMAVLHPTGTVIGSDGGDQTTLTLADAQTKGAGVHVRKTYTSGYRTDFLGFRVAPWILSTT